ncbi:MAG: hypothetical protein ACRBN8_09655 [Nannocystales bacterium]
MNGARALALLLGSLGILACRSESFVCESDEGCQLETLQGFCEPSGHCSFPDMDCESGRRYGENAPSAIAGVCVGGGPGSSTGQDNASSSTGPGASTGGTTTDASSSTAHGSSSSTDALESSGTSTDPTPSNYVFVSSQSVSLGPTIVEDADALCNELAAQAELPGTYVAWLSTDEVSALSRLDGSRGWRRPDGKPVVDRPADLSQGGLLFPPVLDETGATLRTVALVTGTGGGGSATTSRNCNNWTQFDGGVTAAGRSGSLFPQWTDTGNVGCGTKSAHVYCFGTDLDEPLQFAPSQGRVAFTTVTMVPGDEGLAAYDALCEAEAEAAKLDGTFLAVVATSRGSALGRFDLDGLPWVNTAGVPLDSTAAATAVSAQFDTAPSFSANGVPLSDGYWTGATSPSSSASHNCGDWTTLSSGRYHPTTATEPWDFQNTAGCSNLRRILCFEE